MTEIPKPPVLAVRGGCWFRAGAVQLHLGIESDFRPAKKAHPGLRVTGIEVYAARLVARGAAVIWDDSLPGCRRFYSEDPVGNRLEFLDRPSAVSGDCRNSWLQLSAAAVGGAGPCRYVQPAAAGRTAGVVGWAFPAGAVCGGLNIPTRPHPVVRRLRGAGIEAYAAHVAVCGAAVTWDGSCWATAASRRGPVGDRLESWSRPQGVRPRWVTRMRITLSSMMYGTR